MGGIRPSTMQLETLFIALMVPPLCAALFNAYGAVRSIRGLPRVPEDTGATAPVRLSIIVPACNEAADIQAATRAKLDTDHPDVELVIVEDRSTDSTPAIADALAASDPRVRVLHVRELPAGWLGKVHALQRGVAEASGDWLLFSDADVHIAKSLLRRILVDAEARELEFVSAVPHVTSNGFCVDVLMSSFLRMLVVGGRLWNVGDPASRAAAGGGVFNLVRRDAFLRTKGFEWLKLEVADDVCMAQMCKRAGLKSEVYVSEEISLAFYESVGGIMGGLEKNAFALFKFRAGLVAVVCVLCLWLELGPLLGLLLPGPARWVALAALLGTGAAQVAVARWTGRRFLPAAVPVIGATLLILFLVRASLLTLWRGGIFWRGTRYALEELRGGSRIEHL
ncbi:MAG: glycosyltransferase family 2 protein [Polyangiaceae bacterium]